MKNATWESVAEAEATLSPDQKTAYIEAQSLAMEDENAVGWPLLEASDYMAILEAVKCEPANDTEN